MNDKADRRKHPRIPRISVLYVTCAGATESAPALMVDISLGGMKGLTQIPLERGTEITLLIETGDSRIELPAVIKWSQKLEIMAEYSFGVEYVNGIEFKVPPEEIKERLFDKMELLYEV